MIVDDWRNLLFRRGMGGDDVRGICVPCLGPWPREKVTVFHRQTSLHACVRVHAFWAAKCSSLGCGKRSLRAHMGGLLCFVQLISPLRRTQREAAPYRSVAARVFRGVVYLSREEWVLNVRVSQFDTQCHVMFCLVLVLVDIAGLIVGLLPFPPTNAQPSSHRACTPTYWSGDANTSAADSM